MANSAIEFLQPWAQFARPGQAQAFLLELQRELSPRHPLYGLKLIPLGHSGNADDAIFETEDGHVVEVHLSWSGHAEQPPWPAHYTYTCAEEWIKQVMLPQHDQYSM